MKITKKLVSAVMVVSMMVMLMAVNVFAADATVAGEMTSENFLAKKDATTNKITLTNDVKITDKLSANGDLTIDLNGKTLTLTMSDNDVTGLYNVTIKNGTIDLTGTPAAGDGIIRIGKLSGNGGSLTLDSVVVKGENISSGAGTFCLYGSSTLNVLNGSEINIKGEQGTKAYIIYCDDGVAATVNIEKSAINCVDGNSGIFNGVVTLKDSEFNMSGTTNDNGINSYEGGMKLTIDNSDVTISGCEGRALTLSDTEVEVKKDSQLNFSDCKEADIRVKTTGEIKVDETSAINFTANNVKMDDASKNLGDVLKLANGVEYDPATGTIACAHKDTEAKGAVEATCTKEGCTGDIYCKTCGELVSANKTIEKKAHTYKDGKCTVCGAVDPTYKAPATGDASTVAGYMVLCVVALAVVVALKKRNSFAK